MGNKVRFGFKNAYFAPITKDTNGNEQYATPIKMPGAVAMNLSPSGDSTDFYADDWPFFSDDNNNGYEGTIEMALIPEEFKIACLGFVKDSSGVLGESAISIKKAFALLCEFTGDQKARKFVFYKCMASRPELNGTTKGESKEVQTETLSIKIRPASNGMVKMETSEDTDAEVFNGWYNEVYEPAVSM